MRFKSIASHLRPYLMLSRRRTTINHAFAAAIAPSDIYDEKAVRRAITLLGQNPELDLECAYCGAAAKTWDHVFATVKNSQFSGYGHRFGNLLPCCKTCNSRKGNKSWNAHLSSLSLAPHEYAYRYGIIERYLANYIIDDNLPAELPDLQRLDKIRCQVLSLLEEGDTIAARIRAAHAAVAREASRSVAVRSEKEVVVSNTCALP